MSAQPNLRTLQRWMAHVVRHPDDAEAGVRSRAAAALLSPAAVRRGAVVAGPRPIDGLQVYHGGYVARLCECLATDYGALQQLLGEDRFRDLAVAFVGRYPSRHPNLNRFGRELPEFVARRRSLPQRAFVAELARLERAVAIAFDADAAEPLSPAALQAVPPERWPTARLQLHPSVHLLAFRFPVDVAYQQFKDGGEVKVPRPARSWLLVCRHDDQVFRVRLERQAHTLLGALARGLPLGRALALAGGPPQVGGWFQQWAALSVFAGVRLRR